MLVIIPLPFLARSYALSTGIVFIACRKWPIIGLFTLLAAPIKCIYLLLFATRTVPSTNWLEWLLQIIKGPSGIFSDPKTSISLKWRFNIC